MSGSFNTEVELRLIVERLRREADALEEAADVLQALRDSDEHRGRVADAKRRAKEWLRR